MYIISKRKDYYDGVVGSVGVDKTIVYQRECEELNESQIPSFFTTRRNIWGRRNVELPSHNFGNFHLKKESKYDMYSYFIVGFCGKLYLGWKFYKEIHNTFGSSDMITDITYDIDFVKTQLKPVAYKANLDDALNYINTYNAMQLFRDFKVPIFVFDADYNRRKIDKRYPSRDVKFFLNHNISDYEFYKVCDAFKAFQELQMFMGGVLGTGEKEIIEVADKYKIGQHGFDKWSFRKEPQKK